MCRVLCPAAQACRAYVSALRHPAKIKGSVPRIMPGGAGLPGLRLCSAPPGENNRVGIAHNSLHLPHIPSYFFIYV
jgi:hypothetical protein